MSICVEAKRNLMDSKELRFTELVEEYKKTIYTVCYFFSNDTDEVNDLYQEVLINLWQGFEAFRGESSLKTWIWRVSLNTCNNYERKKRHSVQTVIFRLTSTCTTMPTQTVNRFGCCTAALPASTSSTAHSFFFGWRICLTKR